MPLTHQQLTDLIEHGAVLDQITRLELAGHSAIRQLETLDSKALGKLSGGVAGPHGVRHALGTLLDRAVEQNRGQ